MTEPDQFCGRSVLNHALCRGNKRCILEILERGVEGLNEVDEKTGTAHHPSKLLFTSSKLEVPFHARVFQN